MKVGSSGGGAGAVVTGAGVQFEVDVDAVQAGKGAGRCDSLCRAGRCLRKTVRGRSGPELVRIDGGRAEVVMAIFDIRRPFVGEGVFDAGADGPTEAFDVERAAVVVGARVDDAGRRWLRSVPGV